MTTTPATVRTVEDVDRDLLRAMLRRQRHTDPVSQQGISVTIDTLLDERERLTLATRRR